MADTTIREKIARAESERQRIVGNIENTYITIAADYSDVLPAEENSDNLSATVSSALSSAYQEGYHSRDDDIAELEADVSTLEGYIGDTYSEVEVAGYTVPDPTTPEDLASTVNSALLEAYMEGENTAGPILYRATELLVDALAANIGENQPPYRNKLTDLQNYLSTAGLSSPYVIDTYEYEYVACALAIIKITGFGAVLRPLFIYPDDGSLIDQGGTPSIYFTDNNSVLNMRSALSNLRVGTILNNASNPAISLDTSVPLCQYNAIINYPGFNLIEELSELSIGGLTQEHAISGTFVSNPTGHDMQFSGTITLCKLRNTE